MPTVSLSFPSDPAAVVPAAAALVLGRRQFNFLPLTATTAYTVVATTTAASAVTFSSAVSAAYSVHPGQSHHLVWSGLPSVATAGVTIDGVLSVHDQFDNVLSTGPNVFFGNISFLAEGFANNNQNPTFSSMTVTLSSSTEPGLKTLTGFVALKKAGSRWLEAYVSTNPVMTSEMGGDSIRPFITVIPAAPDSVKVTLTLDTTQDAGTCAERPGLPGDHRPAHGRVRQPDHLDADLVRPGR